MDNPTKRLLQNSISGLSIDISTPSGERRHTGKAPRLDTNDEMEVKDKTETAADKTKLTEVTTAEDEPAPVISPGFKLRQADPDVNFSTHRRFSSVLAAEALARGARSPVIDIVSGERSDHIDPQIAEQARRRSNAVSSTTPTRAESAARSPSEVSLAHSPPPASPVMAVPPTPMTPGFIESATVAARSGPKLVEIRRSSSRAESPLPPLPLSPTGALRPLSPSSDKPVPFSPSDLPPDHIFGSTKPRLGSRASIEASSPTTSGKSFSEQGTRMSSIAEGSEDMLSLNAALHTHPVREQDIEMIRQASIRARGKRPEFAIPLNMDILKDARPRGPTITTPHPRAAYDHTFDSVSPTEIIQPSVTRPANPEPRSASSWILYLVVRRARDGTPLVEDTPVTMPENFLDFSTFTDETFFETIQSAFSKSMGPQGGRFSPRRIVKVYFKAAFDPSIEESLMDEKMVEDALIALKNPAHLRAKQEFTDSLGELQFRSRPTFVIVMDWNKMKIVNILVGAILVAVLATILWIVFSNLSVQARVAGGFGIGALVLLVELVVFGLWLFLLG